MLNFEITAGNALRLLDLAKEGLTQGKENPFPD